MVQQHRKTLKHFNNPSQAHALTFSCYKQFPLLSSDQIRRWMIEALEKARAKHNYAILAYAIMPEHVHLLVYPRNESYDVAEFLKSLKQSVSRRAKPFLTSKSPEWLGRLTVRTKRGRAFRFWQASGGYDRNITTTETLMKEIEYICNNPVRRGLVSHAVDWRWSSATSNLEGKKGMLRIDSLDDVLSRQQ